jgi:hypothetical protein
VIVGLLVAFVCVTGAFIASSDNDADRNVPGATTTSGRNSLMSPEK